MRNGFLKLNVSKVSTKINKVKAINKLLKDNYISSKLIGFNLPESEVENNLSLFTICKEDYEKQNTCVKDKCKSRFNGFFNDFYVEQDKIYSTLTPCKCMVEKKGKWANIGNSNIIDLEEVFLKAKLDNLYVSTRSRKMIKVYFQNLINNYPKLTKGLYILGHKDSGKSYALAAFANKLLEKEKDIMVLNCKTNFDELKIKNREYFKVIRDKFKKAKILIVDGIGEEKQNTFTRDFILFSILKHRFDNKKYTIFSSRYKLEALEKKYSKNNNQLQAKLLVQIIEKQSIPIILAKNNK